VVSWQGSGDLMAAAQADCYLVAPPIATRYRGRNGSVLLRNMSGLKSKAKSRKPKTLSHYDQAGRATMVDVSAKTPNRREAEASAFVAMSADVLQALPKNPKGNPLEVARFAALPRPNAQPI